MWAVRSFGWTFEEFDNTSRRDLMLLELSMQSDPGKE